MKKLFFTMLGVCAMLCATSCSDETIVSSVEGESMVEFTVELTDGSDASRAISDGLTVEQLYCEVYSMAGTEPARLYDLDQYVEKMDETVNADGLKVKTATIRMALVKGQAYNVLFWAQAPGAYNLDENEDGKTDLRNIRVAPTTANTESKDAFTAVYKTEKVTGPIKETIVLTRPFAQINFGTTIEDYNDALKAGIDFGTASKELAGKKLASKIVASHGATVYDALTETSKDDGEGLTFGWAEVKTMVENEVLNVGGVAYKYLATAYMLVPGGKESNVSDVTMEIETGLNENITLFVPFAPVQRNYRTNVLGNLLTNTADFTVIVDPNYNTPDNNIGIDQTINVSTAAELQAAIDAAVLGNNIITFDADITAETIIVPQNEGINIVINGADHKFDGKMEIHGKSSFTTNTDLTISDINFETSTSGRVFIWSDDQNAPVRYAHNVTIKGCTFTATGEAVHTAVGAKFRQAKDIQMIDCTATDMHTIFQSESCGNDGTITVDNVTTVNCKNSVSFNNTQNAIIANSKLQSVGVDGYGVRVKGENAGYGLTVNNCEISAFVPVLVRNMIAKGYNIAFEGNNTLTTDNAYQVVISNTDYSLDKNGNLLPLVHPTGEYTLTGAEEMVVYPRDIVVFADKAAAENGQALYNAVNAAANGAVVYLQGGDYELKDNSNNRFSDKSFSLVGLGNVNVKVNTKGLVFNANEDNGTTVNVKNVTIESGSQAVYAKGYATVNLYDVVCKTATGAAILLCSADVQKNGADVVVNAYNVTVDEGDVVYLNANPCSTIQGDIVSYAHFNYEGGNITTCAPQDITRSTGSNLFVNGVALPAYE